MYVDIVLTIDGRATDLVFVSLFFLGLCITSQQLIGKEKKLHSFVGLRLVQ